MSTSEAIPSTNQPTVITIESDVNKLLTLLQQSEERKAELAELKDKVAWLTKQHADQREIADAALSRIQDDVDAAQKKERLATAQLVQVARALANLYSVCVAPDLVPVPDDVKRDYQKRMNEADEVLRLIPLDLAEKVFK